MQTNALQQRENETPVHQIINFPKIHFDSTFLEFEKLMVVIQELLAKKNVISNVTSSNKHQLSFVNELWQDSLESISNNL